ncbi:hypothetical protein NliqN6_2217 [Naganishia liquefaciens]|uniref:Uncharacterized protein n=1 Tax=Naganishia liquefaciens TaxID=104408 RepID=A0A8H3TSH0_9TREE|nr:hypothetical protein NliqN6_2217 [Naganishia liquefaciens]
MSLADIMERLELDLRTERSFYSTVLNYGPTQPQGFIKDIIVELNVQDRAYLLPDDRSDEAEAEISSSTNFLA